MEISKEDIGFYETETGWGFDATRFAQFVIENYSVICDKDGVFYRYDGGKYKMVPSLEFKAILYQIMQSGAKGFWNTRCEKEYVSALERECICSKQMNSYKKLINLKNGMFSLKDYSLKNHSPRYLSTIQLPIEYDETAGCPRFKQFLEEIFLGDKELISFTQELIGYCLATDNQAQSFFIFYGTGANGKSLLCKIITALVGEENCSALSISELEKRFSRVDLVDKLLNISAENEPDGGKAYNSQVIKGMTGGDRFKAEQKGKDIFSFAPFCKFIFAVNTLPNFNDKTEGFLRRVKVIPFNARFSIDDGTADVNLEKKLLKELPGIFNWAIVGLKRLRKNKYCFSYSKAMEDALQDYKELVNPYLTFFEECIEYEGNDSSIQRNKKDVHKAFQTWAYENNHMNLARITPKKFWYEFSATIEQLKLPRLVYKKSGGNRFVVGIKFKRVNYVSTRTERYRKTEETWDDIEELCEKQKEEKKRPNATFEKKPKKKEKQSATKADTKRTQKKRKDDKK